MGIDKRTITIGGVTLLERTRDLLRSTLGKEPILVGDNFPEDTSSCLRDAAPDCGPLGGLVAALEFCPSAWALIAAVDLPYLSTDELFRLLHADRSGFDVLTLTSDGRPEPLAGLYRAATAPYWRYLLKRRRLKLSEGLMGLRCGLVRVDKGSSALLNINEPRQLRALPK